MQDGAEAQQSLFPVGWIHTHPAFDCFLSSVDIHNQYGYQVCCARRHIKALMPECDTRVGHCPRCSSNRLCRPRRRFQPVSDNKVGPQVMLEEAVAIVMSPRDSKNRRCGIFRLTMPGGMDLIKDCRQTGFHTHPPTSTGQKIYELCGHVRSLLPPAHQGFHVALCAEIAANCEVDACILWLGTVSVSEY